MGIEPTTSWCPYPFIGLTSFAFFPELQSTKSSNFSDRQNIHQDHTDLHSKSCTQGIVIRSFYWGDSWTRHGPPVIGHHVKQGQNLCCNDSIHLIGVNMLVNVTWNVNNKEKSNKIPLVWLFLEFTLMYSSLGLHSALWQSINADISPNTRLILF